MFVLGWQWGLAATDRPRVELGRIGSDSVQVLTTEPEATAFLRWTTHQTGRIELWMYLSGQGQAPADLVVVLRCDARLHDLSQDTHEASIVVRDVGPASEECNSREGPIQVVTATFLSAPIEGSDTWGRAQLWGTPATSWVDEAGGERIAFGPFMLVGGHPPVTLEGPLRDQLTRPAQASISTELLGDDGENIESYFPDDLESVQVTPEISLSTIQPSGPKVTWRASWTANPSPFPTYRHPVVTARWSNPSSIAGAQFRLLLSGLLLGIGASVLIEGVFAWARREGRTSP